MRMVFTKNSFIVELVRHFRIYGYDIKKFSGFMGILFGNFSRFMGDTFMI